MRVERWQLLTRVFLVLAGAAFVGAWAGYVECVTSVSNGMTRELNPLTERDLEQLIERALVEVDSAPDAFTDRASLAHPVCYKGNGISDNGMFYALGFLFLVLALFARNQANIIRAQFIPKVRGTGIEANTRNEPIPSEIDVGGDAMAGLSTKDRQILEAVGEVNVRDESLMLYLTRKTTEVEAQETVVHDVDGYFCPPGYHDKPIIYVDPGHAAASDELAGEDPVGNKNRPFSTLGGGIEMARNLLAEGADGVMVRVIPGVYHASIDVPSKVVICNHHMPLEGTPRTRLKWLTEQSVDDENNVTLLAPANAQYAVQFEPGVQQGLFGCNIVGRESVKQAGVVAVTCRGLAIISCNIEGFIGGGLRLQDAGTELAGGSVVLLGCRLHRNEARAGGAIYAERSSVSLAECVVEHNKALTGGAIYSLDSRAPLFITNTRIAHNRAQLDESPAIDVESTPLDRWKDLDGFGGGVYLRNSKLKASGAAFVENGASVGGGALALLNSKAVLESEGENATRFARNRSRLGGGVAAVGWVGARATMKCSNVLFERNTAAIAGGGLLALGMSTVQIFDTEFRKNDVSTEDGFGAGAAAWMGGEFLASGASVHENRSKGHGGGIGVVNARMSLKGGTIIDANNAARSGGGIYAMSTASQVARGLVDAKQLKTPFAITLDETEILNNVAVGQGGGIRGGNELGVATLAIGFRLGEKVTFRLNRTKSQQDNGDDCWVTWAGKVKANDRDLPHKLVLR